MAHKICKYVQCVQPCYVYPTTDCPGPPENITVVSSVPPSVEVWWDRPGTPDTWSFMYLVEWLSQTSAAGDRTSRRVTVPDLEAVTQYAVTITAFTDSTLCAEQDTTFTFNTSQSELSILGATL